ncbi:MAG: CbtA family protein [Solirubrobacteraceae bacterium]|nr:CbtA family protein [Patulibacter sp.]
MAATQIAETRYIVRGFGAGIAGGVAAFVFSKIFAEPVIQQAIDYESGRDAAHDALAKAAGAAVAPPMQDIYSRSFQGGVGIGIGLLLFGAALGGIFSVVYVLASRRWPRVQPRPLAMYVAIGLFVALYLIPFLKYPANPPAIGHEETIRSRSELYLVMVIVSVVSLVATLVTAQRLSERFGTWNGTLLSFLGFTVVIGVVMVILPSIGHLSENLQTYGRHATETPLPLKAPDGTIVYPGFPADVLAKFRLYSVINQIVMWGAIGLVYGPLVQRMIAGAVAKDRATAPEAAVTA